MYIFVYIKWGIFDLGHHRIKTPCKYTWCINVNKNDIKYYIVYCTVYFPYDLHCAYAEYKHQMTEF